MEKINVCVFPAEGENAIEICDALATCVNINVFGASSVARHGGFVYKNYTCNLPSIFDKNFDAEFQKYLLENKINIVFSTHDTVSLYLAEHKDKFSAIILNNDLYSAQVCRDKKKTYDLFKDCDFCPCIYDNLSNLPCFIKPRVGQGAVGAKIIKNKSDISDQICLDDYVITEYLPGKEVTVDCLTELNGNLAAVLPRSRDRLQAGISISGTALHLSEEIHDIADVINQRLKFTGLWYFQLKADVNGKYKLLEVSMRCAGTMCLSRARGVNLPLLSVYTAMGMPISIIENPYNLKLDRAFISRYNIDYTYDTVYIDYDDTIIVRGKVCLPIIKFLYQCKNQNIKVILLTRHNECHNNTLRDDLKAHCISDLLFDEIIELEKTDRKSDFINNRKSVFIDNAFQERKAVYEKHKIPVFDVDGIEVLLDWRV